MLVQAQVVALGNRETGRAQSQRISTPSRASPTGRRIGGYDYKTESIRRPRADNHTRSREMTKAIFSRAGLAGSWTTRVQARRVPADPTANRKPKACQ